MSRCYIVRTHRIDAGHRLHEHEGKCRNIHGHSYTFEIGLSAPSLDKVGRVIDFGQVKDRFAGYLERNMDHGFIVAASDTAMLNALESLGSKTYVMPEGMAPTAENLARHMFDIAIVLFAGGDDALRVEHVTCFETPTSWATWRRPLDITDARIQVAAAVRP